MNPAPNGKGGIERGDPVGFGGPGFDLRHLGSPAAAHARTLLHDVLLADATEETACMSPSPTSGVCRLCGETRKLTFEHIPLEAAGNDRRARAVSMESLLAVEDPFTFPTSGWRSAQRGAGAYVLCKPCNEFIGGHFGGAYARLAAAIEKGLTDLDGKMPRGIRLQYPGHRLGDIARAALVSLLAVSVGHAVIDRDPHLYDMIMNGAPNMPTGLRLGLTIATGARIRLSPPSGICGPDGWSVFMEFAAQPMAWTLSYVDDHLVAPSGSVDVTHWLDIPFRQVAELDLVVPTGVVFNSTPGDYRSEPEARAEAVLNASDGEA